MYIHAEGRKSKNFLSEEKVEFENLSNYVYLNLANSRVDRDEQLTLWIVPIKKERGISSFQSFSFKKITLVHVYLM